MRISQAFAFCLITLFTTSHAWSETAAAKRGSGVLGTLDEMAGPATLVDAAHLGNAKVDSDRFEELKKRDREVRDPANKDITYLIHIDPGGCTNRACFLYEGAFEKFPESETVKKIEVKLELTNGSVKHRYMFWRGGKQLGKSFNSYEDLGITDDGTVELQNYKAAPFGSKEGLAAREKLEDLMVIRMKEKLEASHP